PGALARGHGGAPTVESAAEGLGEEVGLPLISAQGFGRAGADRLEGVRGVGVAAENDDRQVGAAAVEAADGLEPGVARGGILADDDVGVLELSGVEVGDAAAGGDDRAGDRGGDEAGDAGAGGLGAGDDDDLDWVLLFAQGAD